MKKFLFDTGADFTSLPKFMSKVVGVDLSRCRQEIMYTANNDSMITFQDKIIVDLNSKFKTTSKNPFFFFDRVGGEGFLKFLFI